jgi:hypothetical protein
MPNHAARIDWSRALIDKARVRAPCRGRDTGPNPTACRKWGSKHHVLTDARGIPLVTTLTGGQPPRRDPMVAAGGCRTAGARQAWPTPPPSEAVARGSCLRLRVAPTAMAAAETQACLGAARHGARERAGCAPVVCGAHPVLVASVGPPAAASGATPIDSTSLYVFSLRPDLLAVRYLAVILFERSW